MIIQDSGCSWDESGIICFEKHVSDLTHMNKPAETESEPCLNFTVHCMVLKREKTLKAWNAWALWNMLVVREREKESEKGQLLN